MPLWATLYAAIFVALMFIYLLHSDEGPSSRRAWNLIAHSCLLIVFCSYWLNPESGFSPALALLALGWEAYSLPSDVQRIRADGELTNRNAFRLVVAALLLALPAFAIAILTIAKVFSS